MRTLIFSDTHLGKEFEEKKYLFLKKIIGRANQVIINGDFWESQEFTFDSFINSPWQQLFPLLREKKAIYIYGNHDKKIYIDAKVKLFSDLQTEQYTLKSNGSLFTCEHGNRLLPFFSDEFHSYLFLSKTLEQIEKFMLKKINKWLFNWYCKKHNEKIKRKINNKSVKNQYFVFGHTHLGEIDQQNQFINCGVIKHGFAQYLVIEDGKIKLIEERYS